MKQNIILLGVLILANTITAQNQKSNTRFLELSISNPQPRLNEGATVSLNIEPLKRTILDNLPQIGNKEIIKSSAGPYTLFSLKTPEKGKYEVGPLEFMINDTRYITNKILYEVIDPLPETDNGLWIRYIKQSDSTFCIIIEQRIPADSVFKKRDFESLKNALTEDHIALFLRLGQNGGDILLCKSAGNQRGNTSSTVNGIQKTYEQSRYSYFMLVLNRHEHIVLTSKDFVNLPSDYKFEDIIVQ